MTEHRHQRHHARSTAHEKQRGVIAGAPDEVTADRPAELEPVPHLELADQIWRYLAVVQAFDRQGQPAVFGGRRYRVAPLGHVSVLGGQPNIYVLAGQMPRPIRDVEVKACDAGRLLNEPDDVAERPG